MGLLLSREVLCFSLCLITLFSLASCGSTTARSLAQESEINRAPPEVAQFINNKIVNRQYVRERN